MAKPTFRVRLDVPYDFATLPGFRRTMYCHNMRGTGKNSNDTTWKCPATGLIMLRPNFLTDAWYTDIDWKDLSQWTYNPEFWQDVARGVNPITAVAKHFGTVIPANRFFDEIAIPLLRDNISLISSFGSDVMKWALDSKFELAPDEGFCWNYRVTGDELHRPRNWFALSWDNLYLHFSYDGTVNVYTSKDGGWQHFETFEITSPGEIINREGYFTFLPIPGYGLAVYHSHTAQNLNSKISSASSGVSRSHLIKLPQKTGTDGLPYVHNGGKVSVGLGVFAFSVHHRFGMHLIRYNTGASGSFADSVFDPGYSYSTAPAQLRAVFAQASGSRGTSATVTLRNEADSADWTAGTDRKGRLQVNLSTTDAKYTPFVVGTEVGWLPEFTTRDTTAVTPDKLIMLEFTESDAALFSGRCHVHMKSEAERRIAERGDTTILVERCDDPDATTPVWVTQGGGIARISRPVDMVFDWGGMYYDVEWDFTGIEQLYSEKHQFRANAFDGMTIPIAINTVLSISGLPFIAEEDFPAEMHNFKLPAMPAGQDWRWGSKVGDQGDELIRCFLMLAQTQGKAYRLRWDWDEQKMVCEAKPHDTSAGATWTFTPYAEDAGQPRHALFTGLQFLPQPPEANFLQPFGLSEISNAASLVYAPYAYNKASLQDKTSPDYLGRIVGAFPMLAPFGASTADKKSLAYMTRRIYDAACHRRLLPVVSASDYIDDLKPGTRMLVNGLLADGTEGTLFDGQDFWIRHRTVRLEWGDGAGEIAPTVQYSLDSIWEEMV